ncbi:hypothetical protein [Ruegeria arenilitoris]|uniref:hypothetical protein n=1 Tax=Ruegeria arenilitoris TaxID=1173585 RepID=UPI00147D1384|nr:hypothetical protein [Ruegeria arenilitoris]
MKRRTAFPFLTLPSEVVTFGGWMIGDPGQPLSPAQDILSAWDYERDIEVSATLEVDVAEAALSLQLDPDKLVLAAVFRTGTGAGSMPRHSQICATEMISASSSSATLSTRLDSTRLSGRLKVEVSLLLQSEAEGLHALSPVVPGSRLWSVAKDVLIEDGGDSRFPIELVSFTSCFPGAPHVHSPWYVDWKPGVLDADFGGAVRLYVNSDIEDIADRFVEGDALTLQAMLSDVMSQMVASVVALEEAEDLLADCADGSVGQQVRTWMDLAFPGHPVSTIRSINEHLPGKFRAALLSASDVGEVA